MSAALTALTERLRGARTDAFPADGVNVLAEGSYLRAETIEELSAPGSREVPPGMFDVLVAVGRGDLALGRLYEGHVNALGLIERLGTPDQKSWARGLAEEGGLLGVWGADDFARPGRIEGNVLRGRKTYASGASALSAAIIIVKDEEGDTHAFVLEAERLAGRFDPAWWRPLGMATTDSFAVEIDGIEVGGPDRLSGRNAYLAQPYFGGGAVRFVAVQLGGILAVWDAACSHLARTGREADPHQAARLGEMLAECEAAYGGVRTAYARLARAIAWTESEGVAEDALIADAARTLTVQAGSRVTDLAIRSVGCSGLMAGHDLERAVRDLTVYLRQPAPDAALVRAGSAAAQGSYRPVFDD
ncbi:acyl-CoA dehydrogenase family protein [Parvularcula dongshanensis]|uniref:Alkylation response protein AidB-like acyl-CoA dehydrogenase n=1 Tax=Parvularcula dongshanensis TaxID=1173995 RepID=A0A840I2B3_9PROT|nr:acyl-CoA dehydrogenase family protein [Parvularcula dongshanensis]MBB4658423.1 alkylation response protein AidB-like acyl-CoA dehydrogenase [Parvularcula dongshanensis]